MQHKCEWIYLGEVFCKLIFDYYLWNVCQCKWCCHLECNTCGQNLLKLPGFSRFWLLQLWEGHFVWMKTVLTVIFHIWQIFVNELNFLSAIKSSKRCCVFGVFHRAEWTEHRFGVGRCRRFVQHDQAFQKTEETHSRKDSLEIFRSTLFCPRTHAL